MSKRIEYEDSVNDKQPMSYLKRYRVANTAALKERLDSLQQAVEEIKHDQLAINHNHLSLLNETKERTKNSGTVYLSPHEIVVKIFSGLKMYLDPRDIAVVPHLALDSIWEHAITAAWISVIRSTDTVIDVGANFGYFGVLAAQKTDKKKSKVIMFEANPQLVPYINKTLSVNWLNEQSVIENLAVTEKSGPVTLNILKDYLGSSSLQSRDEMNGYLAAKMNVEVSQSVEVAAVTLDEYCNSKGIEAVDVIKMDIEGYEEKAYEGMRNIVKRSPRASLFIEFTKEAYEDPALFYNTLLEDFGNVYLINNDGQIIHPGDTSYRSIIGSDDEWVMPIFSKRDDLGNIKKQESH